MVKALQREFKYVMGDLEQIKKGDLFKIIYTPMTNFRSLLFMSHSLQIPNLIGIYQEYNLANPIYSMINNFKVDIDGGIDEIFFSTNKCYDEVNRNLIHIVFDKNDYNVDVLRNELQDKLDRVVFSDLDNIPNFYEKEDLNPLEIVLSLNVKINDKDLTFYLKTLTEKCTGFGLDRSEAVLMKGIQIKDKYESL